MKNQLADEKFDQMMQKLMSDASLDEHAIDDIVDSPAIWWGVQRRITEQKARSAPWPPVNTWKRWLLIAVPTVAVIVIAAFLLNRAPIEQPYVASNNTVQPASEVKGESGATASPADLQQHTTALRSENKRSLRASISKGTRAKVTNTPAPTPRTEIKTDFIALTYARDPESGQLVRVRVPSSMMVALGLVASVKKPAEMVDAEVLVGDDGLTRAIRFIR